MHSGECRMCLRRQENVVGSSGCTDNKPGRREVKNWKRAKKREKNDGEMHQLRKRLGPDATDEIESSPKSRKL